MRGLRDNPRFACYGQPYYPQSRLLKLENPE
jgi:hypothetical protein